MMDMTYEDDNDIVIKNGDIEVVDEPQASAQRMRDRLLTFRGEWFLNLQFGVPYRDNILIKNPRADVISAILKAEMLKSAEGTFTSFESSFNQKTRALTVSATMETTDGEASVTITI